LVKLKNSLNDFLSKPTPDDNNDINKLLREFEQLIGRILPKITFENTTNLKNLSIELYNLTIRMLSKPISEDTNLLNKLLEEVQNSINYILPKSTFGNINLLKSSLKEIKNVIVNIISLKSTSDDVNLPNGPSDDMNLSNGPSDDVICSNQSSRKSKDQGCRETLVSQIHTRRLHVKESIKSLLESQAAENLRESFTNLNALIYRVFAEQPVFYSMVEGNNKFEQELKHRGLTFQEHFSYDVVLTLTNLASGFGVTNRCNEFIQAAVEEKLGFHIIPASDRPQFRYRIIFNARKQDFEVVYGITAGKLRKLMTDQKTPTEAKEIARANIVNAFSMYDAEGTDARPIDIHNFQGMFTPEFYPRRFALKDSIYSQRLDILAHLLWHVLHRYSTCHPPVTYCELSVGVGDITRPWVFDVLCSFPSTPIQNTGAQHTTTSQSFTNSEKKLRFRDLLLRGHFPSLRNAITRTESEDKLENNHSQQESELQIPKCTYKFLAGFNRQQVQTSYFDFCNQQEAINLLNEAPQIAIHLMLNEINKSANNELITDKNDMFYRHVEQLNKIKESARNNGQFFHWMVGFDLFADEMGFPYCPFVARDFINYVLEIRQEFNLSFGLRIHCGENVPIADATAPAYRHFAAHMYIAFRCLRYLQHELEYGIRIGHGIAFQHILDGTMMKDSKHRKSSVLIAEIEHHARHVFKTIAFEVNITSNEYLLGHAVRKETCEQPFQSNAMRKGSSRQPLQLNALLKLKAPIILATDNDGIWPILKCPCREPSHFSLSGECCRAISTNIIKSLEELKVMFKNMKKFRFYNDKNTLIMPKADNSILPHDTKNFTVIIHPDIIKYIIARCTKINKTSGKFYKDFYKVSLLKTPNTEDIQDSFNDKLTISNEVCNRLAPIAFISYCAEKSETNPDLDPDIKMQYKDILKNLDLDLETIEEYENALKDRNLGPEIRKQYDDILKYPPNVQIVLDEWKSVYQQLIEPNIIDQSQCVSTTSKRNVFFSEGPLTVNDDKKRPMTDLIHYLQRHYHYRYDGKVYIHAFTRYINIKPTIDEIKKQLKRPRNHELAVSIYSTKNKEHYENFDVSEKIELTINEKPLQRTNFQNKPQENGLYAVCPHASAATAFLHTVAKELSKEDDTAPLIDQSTGSLVCTTDLSNINSTERPDSEQTDDDISLLDSETDTLSDSVAYDSDRDNDSPLPSNTNDGRSKAH
jgi:hypothetical protein